MNNPETFGAIYIESGAIVHATTGTLTGETALYRILAMNTGQFRLLAFRNPPAKTIEGSWEYLLMEAARMSDEAKLPRATDDTVVLTKPLAETKPAAMPASAEKSTSVEDTGFKELGTISWWSRPTKENGFPWTARSVDHRSFVQKPKWDGGRESSNRSSMSPLMG